MSDSELCALVAEVWVDSEGDAEGIDYLVGSIKEAIREEILSRCVEKETDI